MTVPSLTPEYRSEYNRRYRLRQFGMTLEDFEYLMAIQGGGCAICGDDQEAVGRALAIDHDHSCCDVAKSSCGSCVRGLLCTRCNVKLDWFERHRATILAYLGVA